MKTGITKLLAAMLLVLGLSTAGVVVVGGSADALTVRTGARWDHMDILLTREETASVARGITGGAVVCWKVAAAGAAIGRTIGFIAASSVCLTAVTVCAAQAYLKGRSAGMTLSPAWYGIRYWCWSY